MAPVAVQQLPTLLSASGSDATSKPCTWQDATSLLAPATWRQIDPAFVERALRVGGVLPEEAIVSSIEATPTAIAGLLSTTVRVAVSYAGADEETLAALPTSVIVKLQAEDELSRQVAVDADNYQMERRVYEVLARDLVVGTAKPFEIVSDSSGNVVFVMEDLSLRQGLYAVSQWKLNGCSFDEAVSAAQALGKLHAQFWSDSAPLPDWLPETCAIEARSPAILAAQCSERFLASSYFEGFSRPVQEAVHVALSKAAGFEEAIRSAGPVTLLHHDVRADNLFWGAAGVPGGVIFLDWQMTGQGIGPFDLAWFLSSSFLEPRAESRVIDFMQTLDVYHRSLVEGGVDGARYPLEAARRDFLLGLLWSFLVVIQVVKFGEPNTVLIKFASRVTHAMAEMGAHSVPLSRLV